MEKPFITIDGKKIFPSTPKMGTWRKFLKYAENVSDENLSVKDFVANACEIISLVFDNPKVTQDSIDNNVDLDEILPLSHKCSLWLQTVFDKLGELPKNAETEKEGK